MDTEEWYDDIVRGIYACCHCGMRFESYKEMVEHISGCGHYPANY